MPRLLLRSALPLLLFAGLLSRPARAQEVTIGDCVRVLKGDSVAMYYNAGYTLTPIACAAIRRHTRISPTGDFVGEVRDYQVANDRLLFRLHYANGRRHGAYEQYHQNGRLVVKGQFANGEPAGIWEFWYRNGKPRQTLEWTGRKLPIRIIASWDSAGAQRASNGNGEWYDMLPGLNRRFGGPIVDGYAHGTWESRVVPGYRLVTTERYSHGKFLDGKALDFGSESYSDQALLSPRVEDPVSWAENVKFTKPCAELQARARERQAKREQAREFTPATYSAGIESYIQTLLQYVGPLLGGNTPLGRAARGGVLIIDMQLDAGGKWLTAANQLPGTDPGAVSQLLAIMQQLPPWEAARQNGQPVGSSIRILGRALNGSFLLSMSPGGPDLPATAKP
ncbi:hypothetical protein LJY25_04255 [Hymenobacter sp. BT175]|uniref:toxin-antitoxin system YwqK family antitoxin n=1 Tax=Hymenobacter translucens TaxID=2886507 RepID=UPI001D0EE30F|nr:hypothetical protein [Hymenobacter translucens]MCC2545646.1 hypothetical protein [Hymenobacter translucens]